ncbi:hypothetical protein AGMMS49587_04090 [Spirochaetia bacterium]|nr:hypothetical protein AGMMS49587_04090 [Spirochaetia bacterium]
MTNLIASVCIIVYIGALSYGAYRIYNSVHERLAAGEQEYANLADRASAAGVLGFMDEPFIQAIDDAIKDSRTILGVIISGPNGEYAFERERGTVITMVNNSPRFSHPFGVSNPPHYMPLRIEGQRNVSIQVVTGYIDYEYCIDILKRVLFVVLAALVMAFFTLLLETLLVKNRGRVSKTGRREESEWEEEISEDDFTDIENSENEFKGFENSLDTDEHLSDTASVNEPSAEPSEQPEPAAEEIPESAPSVRVKQPEPPEPVPEAAIPPEMQEIGPVQAAEPKGLFSPRTHIGWEEYTAERLEAELHRCASYEQDLVFIAMELTASSSSADSLYLQFASEAVSFFTLRDLIFEKGERGISIILPNIDLDQGFANSKEFHNRILSKAQYDICVGLSSRAGRLIDAKRLEFEAFQALKKAQSDPVSPIVAFKSDPEKYREFIRSKNRG